MSWHYSLLAIIILWANSALATVLPNHQSTPFHHSVQVNKLNEQPDVNTDKNLVYTQVHSICGFWRGRLIEVSMPSVSETVLHNEFVDRSVTASFEHLDSSQVYKQVKYSHKLSRYSWLQDKKPKVLSDYNNLSRIVFFHSLPPVNFISKELFLISSTEYNRRDHANVVIQHVWTRNPPDSSYRLGGWKESNTLYKGSVTYYPIPMPTI